MKTVSFTEFRKNASTFIDLVEQGEEVEIQRHGETVARQCTAAKASGLDVMRLG